MLRRSVCRTFVRASAITLNASSSTSPSGADRENELRAEADLRARVTKGMHLNFPTYDHTVYASYETSPGNFNSGGAGISGGASSSSSSSSTAQQQTPSMPQMPFPFGFMNKMTGAASGGSGGNNNNNNGGGVSSENQPKNTLTDWITFITGLFLLGYSLKILMRGGGADADGMVIPMWVGTPMMKAHYIVFSAVSSPAERDGLKAEFANVQRSMPYLSFFDWLNQKYPGWAAGHRYPQEHVMNVVAAAVGPNSDATKIPRLMAGVMQRSSGIGLFGASSAMDANAVDRRKLIDDMVDTISPALAPANGGGGLFGGLIGGTGASAAAASAPIGGAFPPVNAQWGAPPGYGHGYPQQQQYQQQQQYYGGYPPQQQQQFGTASPVAAAHPQQQHQYQQYQQQPQQQQYYQQPQSAELQGTQEVKLSDIIGEEVPQRHAAAVTAAAAPATDPLKRAE